MVGSLVMCTMVSSKACSLSLSSGVLTALHINRYEWVIPTVSSCGLLVMLVYLCVCLCVFLCVFKCLCVHGRKEGERGGIFVFSVSAVQMSQDSNNAIFSKISSLARDNLSQYAKLVSNTSRSLFTSQKNCSLTILQVLL